MLYESSHVRVTAVDGIATLWMSFPGDPVNSLNADRLADIGRGLDAVRTTPAVELLVVRSAKPAGFCGGFDPTALAALETESDATDFAVRGQRVMNRLAELSQVTLAHIDGPCVGPGLELALACDYRLAVAGPDSRLGFGDAPTCWGGKARLARLVGRRTAGQFQRVGCTAREAVKLALIDHAFCERRSKIELRSWLDRLQHHARKRSAGWRGWIDTIETDLAAERVAFRSAVRAGLRVPTPKIDFDLVNPVQPLTSVGLVGDGETNAWLATEFALRGCRVRWVTDSDPVGVLQEPLRRGRVTPLEAEQTIARITTHPDAECVGQCDLVLIDDTAVSAAGLIERELPARTVLAVPPAALPRVAQLAYRPSRVLGLALDGDRARVSTHDDTTPDALATVSNWYRRIGRSLVLTHQPSVSRQLVPV
jgi:enoyl-CoA hydratase/carnithine racemase